LDGEPKRCQRILELVRDLTRYLTQRGGALRLDLTRPSQLELARHIPHPLPQEFEFRCALARRPVGNRLSSADSLGPSNELLQGPAQIPAQMTSYARRDDHQQHEQKDCAAGEKPGDATREIA